MKKLYGLFLILALTSLSFSDALFANDFQDTTLKDPLRVEMNSVSANTNLLLPKGGNPAKEGMDFGDAPDEPYPTVLSSNGARHNLDGITFLGNSVDAEPDGLPNSNATGDDLDNMYDEDGVTFIQALVVGKAAEIKVKASVVGFLNVWIDINMNGSWAELDEHIFIDKILAAGINTLNITLPAEMKPGVTYIRFRFDTNGGLSYDGLAENGEVEDYRLIIYPPDWGFIPTSSSHIISIPSNISFDCFSLSQNDFLGLFYTDENGDLACGGAALWDGMNNKTIVAFGDDPTTSAVKEGFAENEDFYWKAYFSATSTEQDIIATYNPALPHSDGKFHDNGISSLFGVINRMNISATVNPNEVCENENIQLDVLISGGCGTNSFLWWSDPPGFSSVQKNPTDSPLESKKYFVQVSNTFGDLAIDSVIIIVNPLPLITGPDSTQVCLDQAEISLTSLFQPGGGTYSGMGVSGAFFYPAIAGTGFHTITYTYTVPSTGCTNTFDWVIQVFPEPDITCPGSGFACEGGDPIILDDAYPLGGVYSGTGVYLDGQYYFDPLVGAGTYLIEYCNYDSITNCWACCEYEITVHPKPEITCPEDFSVCYDVAAFALTGGNPVGGTYSGIGVSGGMFDPATAGIGTHLITYTYADPNTNCENYCSFKITVIQVDASCPDDLKMCIDESPLTLSGGMPLGGSYSGTGVTAGVFYPLTAGAGSHTITYTYFEPGTNCSASCEFTIVVNPLPMMDCPSSMETCNDDPPVLLTNSFPQGGEYSGIGVFFDGFDYYFNPAIGAGTYIISYCFTDPITGCENCCEFNFVVHPKPVLFCPNDFAVCIDTPGFTLSGGLPSGGSYSGTGVSFDGSDYWFDASVAGEGIHEVLYTYEVLQTSCVNFCNFKITVIDIPDVQCPENMETCLNADPVALEGATPGGGTYSGSGVSGDVFYSSIAGAGSHTIVYTVGVAGTDCYGQCEFEITVIEVEVVCPDDIVLCLQSPTILLDDALPQGGEYAGEGVFFDDGFYYFDPSIGEGTYEITYCYTDSGTNCSKCCEFVITVNADFIIPVKMGWSGISSYVAPNDPSMENILYPITYQLTQLYNFDGMIWPDENINTLVNWDESSGYVINASDETAIPMCGNEVLNKTLNLNEGWNLMPVLTNYSYDIEALFDGVDAFEIAKDVAGTGVFWKKYGINGIGGVKPGKAYFVKMNAAADVTFGLPMDAMPSILQAKTTEPDSPWNVVHNTPGSHTVVFNTTGLLLQANDLIGGFTNDGLCAGMAVIENSGSPFLLNLNVDDLFSYEKDGFDIGEALTYKLYRPETRETYILEGSYNTQMNQGFFETNGLSEITSLKMFATAYAELGKSHINIYPNPSTGIFNIDGLEKNTRITIFNAFGEEVFKDENDHAGSIDLTNQPNGVYILRISTENGSIIKKLVKE